jgi:glycyl-tRNA synthetase alpha subunit
MTVLFSLSFQQIQWLKFRGVTSDVTYGVSHESVWIVIIKQITEVLRNPRDEFIKPN